MSSRIVEEAVEKLSPPFLEGPAHGPRIALALLEDFHGLGKRMVQLVLRNAGHTCLDYGRVTAEDLVARLLESPPDLLLISTLMLRSARRVERVVEGLVKAGVRIPVCVGGAPFRFDPALWREVGADGFGTEASQALRLIQTFAGGQA